MNLNKNNSSSGREFENTLKILNFSVTDNATKYQSAFLAEKGKNIKTLPNEHDFI